MLTTISRHTACHLAVSWRNLNPLGSAIHNNNNNNNNNKFLKLNNNNNNNNNNNKQI